MSALDRWEDRLEIEHPRAYRAVEIAVLVGCVLLFVAVLCLASEGVAR